MRVVLHRVAFLRMATIGRLWVKDGDQKTAWWTLEPPQLANLPSLSCIPLGSYRVTPFDSKKHGAVMCVQGVPGRTAVLFHSLNYPGQTQGCIGPGLEVAIGAGVPVQLKQSRAALQALIAAAGRSFELAITCGGWDYETDRPLPQVGGQ